jgi:hypothetical protein
MAYLGVFEKNGLDPLEVKRTNFTFQLIQIPQFIYFNKLLPCLFNGSLSKILLTRQPWCEAPFSERFVGTFRLHVLIVMCSILWWDFLKFSS